MNRLSEHIQHADWKTEKHVPVIECEDQVQSDQIFEVKVGLGREASHPNKTEHHIRWISLYFHPDGAKFPYEIGHAEFAPTANPQRGLIKAPFIRIIRSRSA